MKTVWWSLIPALTAVCTGQSVPGMVREGKHWAETTSGTVPLKDARWLKITTRGTLRVDGETRSDMQYVLRTRTRTHEVGRARALLASVKVRTVRRGTGMALEVDVPSGLLASADLRVRVPRELKETVLESQGDSIEAYDLNGALRADSGGGRLQVDRIQGDVTVRTGGGQVRLGQIGRNVLCFSGGGTITADTIGGEAGLNTEGGEIWVRVAKGLVRASTRGGNIRVERADKGVRASAQAGLIDVIQAGGPVIAETGMGSIRIRGAGNVDCQAEAGAIQLRAVYGGLRVATRSGSILAELGGQALQDSTLTTGGGDITVVIPSKLAVTIQAINTYPGSHRIVSDFPEIRPRLGSAEAETEALGTINGGGPMLRLTASGGTIYLRRQK